MQAMTQQCAWSLNCIWNGKAAGIGVALVAVRDGEWAGLLSILQLKLLQFLQP